jgi:hypothetical protein
MGEAAEPPAGADGIPVAWRRWAAVSLMRGIPVSDVLDTLAAEGFDDRAAVMLCASLYESPALDAGRWLAGQLAKQSSVLTVREQVADLAGGGSPEVARLSGVSKEEFLLRYYAANEPVVLTDVCGGWSARTLWNLDYLADVLGSVEASVAGGLVTPFIEFAAKAAASPAVGLALAGGSRLLATEAATPLWEDFTLDDRYLEADPGRMHATLRIGAAGSVTSLRHELKNLLSCQVDGWQHVILIPALQTYRVYNSVSVFSDVDPVAPDLDRYPLFAAATQLHLDLGPGQALFIPVGWWYHVECTEPGIGIDFTNFAFLNTFTWANPEFPL